MAQLRADYARLKAERWGGYAGYDALVRRGPTTPTLGVLAAYDDLVPAFERLFEREGRDFARFYAEVRRLAALPKDERHAALARHSRRSRILEERPWPTSTSTASPQARPAKARKIAWKWAETVEEKFGMECTVIEGDDSDIVEFTRSRRQRRAAGRGRPLRSDARLGFLLGAFRRQIEAEIEGSSTSCCRRRPPGGEGPSETAGPRRGVRGEDGAGCLAPAAPLRSTP